MDFFFILSGFIIFYVYGKNFEKSVPRRAWWKYIGARFARVYPLHLFTLIWCTGCTIIINSLATGIDPFFAGIFDLSAIPASLVMLQSIHLFDMTRVYMLFPFMVPLFLRLSSLSRLITIILIAGAYMFIRYIINPMGFTGEGTGPTINVTFDYGLLRCLAGFLLGMLLYVCTNPDLLTICLSETLRF